jgi:large subunit ribosomal protein L10
MQTKEQKKKILEELKERVDRQKSVIFVAIEGLKAKDIFSLRETLKAADCLMSVVKKTLLDIVAKEKKISVDARKGLSGQVAVIFGFKDEISPAKIIHKFSLENKNLKILGGWLEGKLRTTQEVSEMAKLPSREELLSKVVGSVSAPISGFVNVLQGNIKGLVRIFSQIKK